MTKFERLPKNVIPVNYDLELEPDLKNFTFNGRAIVDVNVIYFVLVFIMQPLDYFIKIFWNIKGDCWDEQDLV